MAVQMKEISDNVTIKPSMCGPHGKAWLIDLKNGLRLTKHDPVDDAALCHWVVEAPFAHPVWHSYSIICVHLRPRWNGDAPVMYREDATHELWVIAIDPDADRQELINTGLCQGVWLQPLNFASQFVELTDDLARERIERTVQDVIDGKLDPDTDSRADWVRRFGSNMLKGY